MLRKRVKEGAVPMVVDVNIKHGWWHAVLLSLSLIIASCVASVCVADDQNVIRLGFRDMVMGVHFIDKTDGWAVGNFGLALKTSDGGKSWQRMDLETEESLKAVCFVGEKGWIVGERGLILQTDDSGRTWHKQTSGIEKNPLLDVFFVDENKGFIVGGDGTILKTADGGLNWDLIDMDWMSLIPEDLMMIGTVSINLYKVYFSSEPFGWIVGDAGTVLRTQDGGETWRLVQMADLPALFSVCFKNDREGWAAGNVGFFLETYNGGETWQRRNLGVEKGLYKIRIRGDHGVIVGDMATVIMTNDGGITWVKQPLDLPPPYPWFGDAWILPSSSSSSSSSSSVKVLVVGAGMILDMGISSKR